MASVTSNAPTATVTRIVTATASALADPLIYSQFNVNRISIKVAAISLMFVNLFVFFRTFKNRTSTVAILSFLFMFVQQLGVIIQFLPDVSIIPKNDRISIWGGVGCLMLSSELFVWTLFIRFQIVAPFKRHLQNWAKAWMILESAAVLANYLSWGVAIELNLRDLRIGSAKAYSGVSIVQSITAAALSGYFMVTYYWPRLRSVQGQKVWLKLWSSGFFYLTLEVLLHTTYTVSFQISTQYYSTVTTLATALRFSLFLLFVYQIRHASKVTTTFGASSTGSSNKSSNNTSKYAEDNLPSYNSQSKPRPQQESYHLNHVGPSMPLIALDTSQPVRGPISPPSQQRNQNYVGGASEIQIRSHQLPYQQVPEPTAASPMTVGGRHVAFSHAEEGVPVSRMLPPERDEKYYQNL